MRRTLGGGEHKPLENTPTQPGVLRALGMPLHPHEESRACAAHGLNHTVLAGRQHS